MSTETISRRPGTKPTQFRLDDSYLSRLEKLAELHSAETGMNEDRTSVIRRLIAEDYLRRKGGIRLGSGDAGDNYPESVAGVEAPNCRRCDGSGNEPTNRGIADE